MCNVQKTTAEIVNDLADALLKPDIPLSMEAAVGHAIARFVEAEPDNPELDSWRDLLRMEAP